MEQSISVSEYDTINFEYERQLVGLDVADDFAVEYYSESSWTALESLGSSSANDGSFVIKVLPYLPLQQR